MNARNQHLDREREPRRATILFITSCSQLWGGSEELWAGAALKLKEKGYKVATGRMEGKVARPLHRKWKQLRDAGVGINDFSIFLLFLTVPDLLYKHSQILGRILYYLRNLLLTFTIRRLKPDLVVISQGGTFDGMDRLELPLLARWAGVPYVLICQKSSEMDWPYDEVLERTRNHFMKATGVYFVSRHNSQITEQQLGISLPNSEVVRNPFMIKSREPLPWPEAPNGVLKLACVGRMWPREKGQDILLIVLAKEKWRLRPVEVNFYGEGAVAQGLAGMAAYLGLTNVRFCGQVPDITDVWREHHALVMPSRSEGLALAQVEAMLCGRVVIMAPAGGAGEIIDEGVTGFMASSASEEALDLAMERAWERREEWREIGLKAAETIQTTFPEDPCAAFADKLEGIVFGSKAIAKISA